MISHLGEAKFTRDMAETLVEYFDVYAVKGVVTVEITDAGLWLPNPHFVSRQFLGLAELPQKDRN